MEVVFLHFEVWVADLQGFEVRFGFSMSKSPRGQVLNRFRWIGAGFIRVGIFKNSFFVSNPFMGLPKDKKNNAFLSHSEFFHCFSFGFSLIFWKGLTPRSS